MPLILWFPVIVWAGMYTIMLEASKQTLEQN